MRADPAAPASGGPRLGLAANWRQVTLLVVVNAFVGAMVGLERSVLPLLAEEEFGVASASAVLSFVAVFGLVKAVTNGFAGHLADRFGRRRLLVVGWLAALPVAPMIIWAPSWGWVVAANAFLGLNQGLAWSMTVVMKVDLAGPRRRGTVLGLNEAAGYGAVAVTAWATAALAAAHGPRPAPFLLGLGIAAAGLVLSAGFVRDTAEHLRLETASAPGAPPLSATFSKVLRRPSLASVTQAGFVTNLNDGMVWGLLPVFLAAEGLSLGRIGVVTALYPASWGLGQLFTGAWSDRVGRKPLIVGGLWLQAAGIGGFLLVDSFAGWTAAALTLGVGTALVYPTLLAAVGDFAEPSWRASALGVYRLWRDLGFVAGALLAGGVADAFGMRAGIGAVAVITAVSGGVVVRRMEGSSPSTGNTWGARLRRRGATG